MYVSSINASTLQLATPLSPKKVSYQSIVFLYVVIQQDRLTFWTVLSVYSTLRHDYNVTGIHMGVTLHYVQYPIK